MKSKKLIGITGSIASGKSTASKLIQELGYEVIDSDKIAHILMKKGNINYYNIVNFFGVEILDIDKEIDRKKLGKIVFNDKEKLEKLNKLTHHNIFHNINNLIQSSKEDLIFVDIPLLIELKLKGNLPLDFNHIALIYVDVDTQLERLMKRDKINKEEALSKVNSQMSIEDKRKYCDIIIDNSKDLNHLELEVRDKLRLL